MGPANRIFSDRIFPVANTYNGETEWFCLTREGVKGPYPTAREAEQALSDFIEWCRLIGWTGGREVKGAVRRSKDTVSAVA